MISYHTCPLASEEGKETGGMNVYVLELAKELASMGHKVDIFTRSQDVHNKVVVQITENLRLMHLPAGPQKPLSKNNILPYIDQFVGEFKKFVEEEKIEYDVLHCHYYLSGLVGLKIKESTNLPIVMSFHTLALMKNLVARSEAEKEDKSRIQAEFQLVKAADHLIASSEAESAYINYLYECPTNKITVIPPGVNRKHFYPIDKDVAKEKIGVETSEKIVLFVGRIEPLKGIDSLIYAMKIITTQCPNLSVRLIIVGGDVSQKISLWKKELQTLEALRSILNIPNIVRFVGQRKQEELRYYYNSAEVVVMPSHYESFGMTALEAMSCGIPVIASNITGVANIIDEKHDFLITSVNNPLLLAAQIEYLLTNEKLHAKVSQEVLQNVTDFTWTKTAEKTLGIYNSLTQNG